MIDPEYGYLEAMDDYSYSDMYHVCRHCKCEYLAYDYICPKCRTHLDIVCKRKLNGFQKDKTAHVAAMPAERLARIIAEIRIEKGITAEDLLHLPNSI